MSIDHNRIKVADLEKNQPNKILTTNSNGELEFGDMYNDLDCMVEGKVLDARQGKELKKLIDNINDFLRSDNSNLDTVQELVDAIETVQNSLNTILVNDLSMGGTTKALTAEMGKILKGFIDNLTTVLNNHLGSEDAHNELFENKVDKEAGKSLLSDTEITRLATLSNYTHPVNHPASIIVQDSNNRFVTDAEKAAWNDKPTYTGSGANGTWGISISGTAASATNWGSRQADFNATSETFDYVAVRETSSGIFKLAGSSAFLSFLGLTNAVTGTGTNTYFPKFTGAGTLGNSSMYESGGAINTNLPLIVNGLVLNNYFSYCHAVGNSAFATLTSGSNSVAFGVNAGRYTSTNAAVTSVIDSLFIGATTKALNSSSTSEIVIGSNVVGLGDYTSLFGNNNTNYGRWMGALLLGTNAWDGASALQISGGAINTSNGTAFKLRGHGATAPVSPSVGDVFYDNGRLKIKSKNSGSGSDGSLGSLSQNPINLMGLGIDSFWSDNGDLNNTLDASKFGYTSLIKTPYAYQQTLSVRGTLNAHPDMYEGTLLTSNGDYESQQLFFDSAGLIYARGKGYVAGQGVWRKYVYQGVDKLLVNTLTDNGSTLRVNGTGWFDNYLIAKSISAANYRNILSPDGGALETNGIQTGAIKITLPVSWDNTMLKFSVEVFDYETNKSFTVKIAGYNFAGAYWVNTSAYITANNSVDRNFTVRFGYDTSVSKCCIYIGELNSTWNYLKVSVIDVQPTHSGANSAWTSGWVVGLESSSFSTITDTITNTQIRGISNGTANYMPKYTGYNTLGNSGLQDLGSSIGLRYYTNDNTADVSYGIGKEGSSGNSIYLGWRFNGGTPYGFVDTWGGGSPLVLQSSGGSVLINSTTNNGLGILQVNGNSWFGNFLNISGGFSSPASESGYRLKFSDNGGTNNDSGIGLNGGAGNEQMWFNTLGGFSWQAGTGGEKMSLSSGGTTPNNTTLGFALGASIQARLAVPQIAMSSNINGDYYDATYKTNGYATQLFLDAFGGTMGFRNAASGIAGNAVSWNTRFFIDPVGNIGAGTTSLDSKFTVAGALGSTAGAGGSTIKLINTDTGNQASITAGTVGNYNSGLSFYVDGVLGGRFSGNSNLIVGSGADNGYKLRVGGYGWFDGGIYALGAITSVSTDSNFLTGDLNVGYSSYQGYKLAINGAGYFNGNVTAPTFSGNLLGNVSGESTYLKNNPFISSDVNNIYRVGSYSLFNATNTPFGAGDGVLVNFNTYTGVNSSEKYNLQLSAGLGNSNLYFRGTGIDGAGTWKTILDSNNYNFYSPTLTGGGASGNWNINITGNSFSSSATDFVRCIDTRAVVTTPQTINGGVRFDFKDNTIEGLSDGGTFFGEMTFRPYGSGTDFSGGGSHQLGFTANGNLYHRDGAGTSWNSWRRIFDNTGLTSGYLTKYDGTKLSNSSVYSNGSFTGVNTTTDNGYTFRVGGSGYFDGVVNINRGSTNDFAILFTSSGVATRMGSLNGSYFHMQTDATSGFYMYQDLTTASSIYTGNLASIGGNTYSYGGLSVGGAGTRTGNLAISNAIAIGDSDTGFRQNGDGVLETFANNVRVRTDNSGGSTYDNGMRIGVFSEAVGNDPYGLISVTRGTASNFSYYGLTRSGQIGISLGISTGNAFIIGTGANNAGAITNNMMLLDTGGNLYAGGAVSGTRIHTGYDSGEAGSVSCSNWFRSNGSTGWFNASYGGGIYMTDSTYVRVYNDKAFKVNNVIEASGDGGFASSTYILNSRNPIWRFKNADTYGISYFQGTSGIDGSQDSIGFHFGGATATDSKVIIHYDGSVLMSGVLYVGRGTTSSSIRMQDSDEGERYLHCNSNRIGFLTQAGSWGAYCLDDGSWNTEGNMSVAGTVTATAFYASSDIRLKELTNYKPKVADLKPISFTWKDKRDEKVHIGYPAQEVQKVLPDAVQEDEKGFLSVDYIQVLVAKMAEMEEEINNLKKRLQ